MVVSDYTKYTITATSSSGTSQASVIFNVKDTVTSPAVWTASFVGVSINIELDSQSNYYVTGNSTTVIASVNLNPDGSVVLPSGIGVYIIKYNSVGTALWCKKFNCTSPSSNRVLVDSSDNVYILGNGIFGSSVNINGDGLVTLSSSGTKIAGFIVKYNSSGVGLWAKIINSESVTIAGADIDKVGNIYISGRYWVAAGQTSLDLGNSVSLPTTANSNNTYIAKFNSSGVALVAKNLGISIVVVNSFSFDSQNNMFAGGYYYLPSGQINLNTSGTVFLTHTSFTKTLAGTTNTVTHTDGFIVKFNPSNLEGLWKKEIKGVFYTTNNNTALFGDNINKIVIDSNDNIYACGNYVSENSIDLNGDGSVVIPRTNGSSSDMFLAKINSSGVALWATNLFITNTNRDTARYITLDHFDNVYVIGQASTASVTTPLVINGITVTTNVADSIILKYSTSGDIESFKLIGGTSTDDGKSIIFDSNSNSYVVYGNYVSSTGTLDLNGDSSVVLPMTSTSSVFIVKYGQNVGSDIPLPTVTNISDIISEYGASSVEIGNTLKLNVITDPINGSVSWESSDTAFATVNNYGVVSGVSQGTVTITATYGIYISTKVITVVPVRTITTPTNTLNGIGAGLDIFLTNPEPNTVWYLNNNVARITNTINSGNIFIETNTTGTFVVTAICGGKMYSKTINVVTVIDITIMDITNGTIIGLDPTKTYKFINGKTVEEDIAFRVELYSDGVMASDPYLPPTEFYVTDSPYSGYKVIY
jgi:hypothetical protein